MKAKKKKNNNDDDDDDDDDGGDYGDNDIEVEEERKYRRDADDFNDKEYLY